MYMQTLLLKHTARHTDDLICLFNVFALYSFIQSLSERSIPLSPSTGWSSYTRVGERSHHRVILPPHY